MSVPHSLGVNQDSFSSEQEITAADLFHLPYADMLKVAGSDLMEEKQNVTRYVYIVFRRGTMPYVSITVLIDGGRTSVRESPGYLLKRASKALLETLPLVKRECGLVAYTQSTSNQ